MKRLLALSVLIIVLWSLSISITMVIGYVTQAAHREALRTGFGSNWCEQACWHGLQIDKTTYAEVTNSLPLNQTTKLLDPDPHSTCEFRVSMTVESSEWTGDVCVHGETLREIYLRTDEADSGFTFGDALAIWGAPESITCSNYIPDAPSYTLITLHFKSGMGVSIVRPATRNNMFFGPNTPINRVFYVEHIGFISHYIHSWGGFVSNVVFKAGYCQQQTP
jgi:hypothetical protein